MAQNAKVNAKHSSEANHFFSAARRNAGRRPPLQAGMSERDLFKPADQGAGGINFDKYDAIEVERSGPGAGDVPSLDDFTALFAQIPKWLGQNVERMGYRKPTPIQKHAVPLIMSGRDVLCAAQTGSGKTAAFLLPMLGKMADYKGRASRAPAQLETPARPKVLVLAPTRELASQISLECTKLTFKHDTNVVCCYGGVPAPSQLDQLSYGVDVLVATPGRLTDFLERDIVYLGDCYALVLDEADRMLDMGFRPQLDRILRGGLPPSEMRQTCMFSATFPVEIQRLAAEYMKPYVYVAVGRVGSTSESISQEVILMDDFSKPAKEAMLCSVLEREQGEAFYQSTIVFVQTKANAERLTRRLNTHFKGNSLKFVEIHGDRSQSQRESALAAFRGGTAHVMIATDVAARGLDVPNVAHVINVDLPHSPEDFDSYVHRIGRTGRAGKTGKATSFFVNTFDTKHGNARIASQLAQLLSESGQDVPGFLGGKGAGGGKAPGGGGGARKAGDAREGASVFKFTDKRGSGGGGGGGGKAAGGPKSGGPSTRSGGAGAGGGGSGGGGGGGGGAKRPASGPPPGAAAGGGKALRMPTPGDFVGAGKESNGSGGGGRSSGGGRGGGGGSRGGGRGGGGGRGRGRGRGGA
jgi:ATP-dependent RNA helicase DDX3X